MTMRKHSTLFVALLLLVSAAICDSESALPAATPMSSTATVVKVCDWGEENVCERCNLTFTWIERGVLFYKIAKDGQVIPGSAPASCSLVER